MDDGLLFKDNKSKNLIIFFGGIRNGLGAPVFEFHNFIKKINIDSDFLFVIDHSQAWYHFGISGYTKNINETAKFLKENYIDTHDNIITFGNSMGGFAAILFGSLLNIESYAFGPQTFVCPTKMNEVNDTRWRRQRKKLYTPEVNSEFFDLSSVINNSDKVNIFVSGNQDLVHSDNLKDFDNVIIKEYKDGGHNLIKYLRDNGELAKIIRKLF
jgi:hypothetical protein